MHRCYVVRDWPVSHYVTHDAHHSQVHSQQRTITQYNMVPQHPVNTLATGYGDFRTSVAKRRRQATEISVFTDGWMEEGVGFVMC